MYSEEEYIQLSALQHFLFCKRQCALAYLEECWTENELTALGRIMHNNIHDEGYEKRGDLIKARGLRIASSKLGLSGQTDIVEFKRINPPGHGVKLKNQQGEWVVFPVEYKRGKPKTDKSDEVQLCAQAICLEEMMDAVIIEGALYYGKNKRRYPVSFDKKLRGLTEETAAQIHEMFRQNDTPPAEYSKKCKSCSLIRICLPEKTRKEGLASRYIKRMIEFELCEKC
jgi:CRISPR-associated exonuclease Cas4